MASIDDIHDPLIITDGRQSEMAASVQRGTCRMLRALGQATLTELPLANGRRADIVTIDRAGTITIIEVKSSIADFRSDFKWPEYRDFCDLLYFAIPPEVPVEIMPEDAGLIIADRFGAEILRAAAEDRLAAARRKAMTLRIARAAALRLHDIADPGLGLAEL
jgi:hypothetical protein